MSYTIVTLKTIKPIVNEIRKHIHNEFSNYLETSHSDISLIIYLLEYLGDRTDAYTLQLP
jgi:hypothetical protein